MSSIIFCSMLIYVIVWFITFLIYWGCCHSAKIHFKRKDWETNVERTRVINFEWTDCGNEKFGKTKTAWIYFLIPFVNILWKYCKYKVVVAHFKEQLETNYYSVKHNYKDETDIGGYSAEHSWYYSVPRSLEYKALEKMNTYLGEIVYYLPIVLLLVVFFIGKF